MSKLSAAFLSLLVICCNCFADQGEDQANSFANIYATTCLKHLSNLEELHEKLKDLPKLPAESAAKFLAGRPGEAWPVPDKHGLFVVALLEGKNMCVVYARRANTEVSKQLFNRMVAIAPPPLTSRQILSKTGHSDVNGEYQTVSYEWSVPNATRTMLFTISTSQSETAEIQVMASAAIVRR